MHPKTSNQNPIRIVVIGGGTGTFTVLSGLKKYPEVKLQAIVAVTDSGGSSGKLRDQYGILPVGDIRQCLVALADDNNGNNILRELFLYRFDKGEIRGHNFGNLFLTAMTEILGSEEKAIAEVSKVLKIKGSVIPISTDDIDLVATYSDGTVLVGESQIDEPNHKHDNTQKITELRIQPDTQISPKASHAITHADLIILGPGDIYSSILANIVVPGAKKAIQHTHAKIVYIVNLMTKLGQTHGYTASEHVSEIAKYTGRTPEFVLMNNKPLPEKILHRYKKENAFTVIDDLTEQTNQTIIRTDLLSEIIQPREKQDNVHRSLIRHDSNKIAKVIYSLATSVKNT